MNTTQSDYYNFDIPQSLAKVPVPQLVTVLNVVLQLALSQRFVESVAQRQVGLVLGAGQELLNLPRARTGGGVSFGTGVLRNRSRSGLLHRSSFLRVRAAKHSGHGVSNGVADGGTDCNTSGRSGHLGHQTGTLAGGGHRRCHGRRWGMLDHRRSGGRGRTWGSSCRCRRGSAGSWRGRSGPSTARHLDCTLICLIHLNLFRVMQFVALFLNFWFVSLSLILLEGA